jgi:hypothetical protein
VEIVRTSGFDKDVKRLSLTSSDVAALMATLAANPQAGDVIQGLKGVRKVRFGIPSRNIGKSGGGRAIYLVLEVDDMLVLLKAYGKNEQDDLSTAQRREALAIIERL